MLNTLPYTLHTETQNQEATGLFLIFNTILSIHTSIHSITHINDSESKKETEDHAYHRISHQLTHSYNK